MAKITDLISAAINKSPLDFAEAAASILQDKAVSALADRKIEIAQSLYQTESNDIDIDLDLESLEENLESQGE